MVRTKADAYTKASFKASRKQAVLRAAAGQSTSSPKSSHADKYAGGNSYCPRPVPKWQKPITSFFSKTGESSSSMDTAEVDTAEVDTAELEAACSSLAMSEPGASASNDEGNVACSNDNDKRIAAGGNDKGEEHANCSEGN